MRLRTFIFWTHLAAGVLAGLVILMMCVTGALLTYERQIYAWYDSGYRSHETGNSRLPLTDLLARVHDQAPDVVPATVTINADADGPVTIAAGPRTLYVDAYSGQVLGETNARGARQFMSSLKAWHRWIAVEGDGRASARAITGWSNLLFLFIVASGIYLWVPRRWGWQHIKAVALFNGRLRGKARDFNWHNVIGSWSAIPLFIVVFSAVPISFPWANAAVYRALGDQVPAPGGREGGAGRQGAGRGQAAEGGARVEGREGRGGGRAGEAATRGEGPDGRGSGGATAERGGGQAGASVSLDGVDTLFARARQQEPEWRTISLRLPASARAPLAFAIDRGDGGQPQLRSTLTLTRTGETVSYESFASQSPGRKARSIMRFAHTGEVLGLTGQTIAGLATTGGAVLVYTGIALALRRLRAWMSRRGRATAQDTQRVA